MQVAAASSSPPPPDQPVDKKPDPSKPVLSVRTVKTNEIIAKKSVPWKKEVKSVDVPKVCQKIIFEPLQNSIEW